MAIERPHRTQSRRTTRPAGPATFDAREAELAEWVHHYVRLRDACLSPSAHIADKLDRLGPLDGGLVAHVATVRHAIQDTGGLLPCERRRLVLLDVLAALPPTPDAETPWSRHPVDLLGEAATGIGYTITDVRRLSRTLAMARAALPPIDVSPSTVRAVADSLREVTGETPGAALAHAVLLLGDRMPRVWAPSACGTALLDPGPGLTPRFLGSVVARHDLSAFVEDLATLRVAANLSSTVARYAEVMLPELAEDLRSDATRGGASILGLAADLVDRTGTLIPRGFRRFGRTSHSPRARRILVSD